MISIMLCITVCNYYVLEGLKHVGGSINKLTPCPLRSSVLNIINVIVTVIIIVIIITIINININIIIIIIIISSSSSSSSPNIITIMLTPCSLQSSGSVPPGQSLARRKGRAQGGPRRL